MHAIGDPCVVIGLSAGCTAGDTDAATVLESTVR